MLSAVPKQTFVPGNLPDQMPLQHQRPTRQKTQVPVPQSLKSIVTETSTGSRALQMACPKISVHVLTCIDS